MTRIHCCDGKLLCCLALCVILASGLSGCNTRTGPVISFETTEISAQPQGGHVHHRFVFRNVGNKALEIFEVRSSCGCMVARPEQTRLEPGDSSWIQADMTAQAGRKEAFIAVKSNDSQTPTVLLTLKSDGKNLDTLVFLPDIARGTFEDDRSPAIVHCLLRLTHWYDNPPVTREDLESLEVISPASSKGRVKIRKMDSSSARDMFSLGASTSPLPGVSNWLYVNGVIDRETWFFPLEIVIEPPSEDKLGEDNLVQARIRWNAQDLEAYLRLTD